MLTLDFIKQYLKQDIPYHDKYHEANKIHEGLEVHACGEKPVDLLRKARPNESDIYQKWREERWSPITKTIWQKVIFTSAKVRKADDWNVEYKESTDGEDLEQYLSKNYPYFDSLDNWFWNYCFNQMFSDPNAVICVIPLPKKNPSDDTEAFRPFTYVYESENVIDFKENEYAVILTEEKSDITIGGKPSKSGRVFLFISDTQITKAVQIGEQNEWKYQLEYYGYEVFDHNIGYLPVFQLGGIINKFDPGYKLYDSFISPCIPHWDEAIMDFSDHQVNKAIHLHPDRWEIADSECGACKGIGTIDSKDGSKRKTKCGSCNGLGKVSVRTPFGVKTIKPSSPTGPSSSVNIPTPPMGYADRPIESLSFLKKEYEDDIRQGLSAVNMDWLMNTPENQSGVAKAYDRDPLASYYGVLAKHIVENIYNPSIYFIARWRNILKTEEEVKGMLPTIAVPQQFDVIISSQLSDSVKAAHDAGMSASVTAPLEVQFAKKQFGDDSDQAKVTELMDTFDPLAGKTDDEKMTILSNKGCTQEDYILSSKLYSFIKRAVKANPNFMDLQYDAQKTVFDKYITETVTVNQKNIVPIVQANA